MSEDFAGFVEVMNAAWRAPTDAELLAATRAYIAPGAPMRNPLIPTGYGPDGLEANIRALVTVIPGLRGEVVEWATQGDQIWVLLRLYGRLGRRWVTWDVCDRFRLRDGMITDRDGVMDSIPALRAVLAHPPAWPRAVYAYVRMRRDLAATRR